MSRVRHKIFIAVAAAIAVVVIVALIVQAAGRKPAAVAAKSIGARLDLVAGDVLVVEDGARSKALSGLPLAMGATVSTGKGSRAYVRAGDGAGLFLRGETDVTLGERSVELGRGEVWFDAARVERDAASVKVGAHVVTASGAGLSVAREGDQVTVYVARGLATLSSPGGRVEVNAGEQAVAKGGDTPKVNAVAFWQDWTGGMGDARANRATAGSGSGRIYGIDPMARAGARAVSLGIAKQAVRAVIRDGVAETEVDQTFSNPADRAMEGWYWFTLPPDAAVTSFALETDGVLVEGEVTERREAATKYAAAMRTGNDPALLEWVDGRSYRARIFPIPASGTRRVVLRYSEVLPLVEGKTRYVYPLRSDDPIRFDEFMLSVDTGATRLQASVAASLDATIDEDGRKVTMRRSGYVPRSDFQLELTATIKAPPLRVWRFEAGADQADYVMARFVPDVDFAALPSVRADIALAVDTSAGGDESARVLRMATAEAVLRALSPEDHFALLAVDVAATVLYPKEGLASATPEDIARALERLSEHTAAGATDLAAMFEPSLARLHGAQQPAVIYVGDGAPTSGEWTPDALTDRLRRSLAGSRARLFCVGVGTDARHDLMDHLSRTGGGRYVRVDDPDDTTARALQLASLVKTPTITDVELDLGAGLDQPFFSTSGTLSRGEELVLLARTHHRLPRTATVRGRLSGKDLVATYDVDTAASVVTGLVPRFWASAYIRDLLGSGLSADDHRSKVLELGLEYGLMTPFTSILALESEAAFARMNVRRRTSPLRGVRLTALETTGQEERWARRFSPSAFPAVAMGCRAEPASSDSRDEPARAAPSPVASAAGAQAKAAAPSSKEYAGEAVDNVPAESPAGTEGAVDQQLASGGQGFGNGHGRLGGAAAGLRSTTGAPAAPPPAAATNSRASQGMASLGSLSSVADSTGPAGAAAVKKKGAPGQGGRDRVTDAKDQTMPRVTEADKVAAQPPRQPISIARRPPARCSDAASRPLPERVMLWARRLHNVNGGPALVEQYELARSGCELPDWRDQSALLEMIQQRVDNEDSVEVVLAHFAFEPDAQKFLARGVLRRTVDARMAAAVSRVLFGGKVDWAEVDRDVLETTKQADRLTKLRKAMLVAPGDPAGEVRLVRLLAASGQLPDALSRGRRLRDRGLMTPLLAQCLGDVLAQAGERDEALRTYSEIVEFDPANPASRRVLGDAFLRHGWYAAAYRQYRTLADLEPKNPINWLRLASSAAGTGRIDEALRIEREVTSDEGSPGPNDPRLWARLWSGARLGLLLDDPTPAGGKGAVDSIVRKLKELQLWSGPGTLSLLTWEDLDASLVLNGKVAGKETLVGEPTDAAPTGLYALLLSRDEWDKTSWTVRWRSDTHGRSVRFAVVRLDWDGRAFAAKVDRGEVKPDQQEAPL